MSKLYRTYNPNQTLLLPPSVEDWVPADDLAHFISDTIDELDLSAFHRRYRGDGAGNLPYDPRMMLKILIYAYSQGVFSSRRIAQALKRDIGFRMLAADNFPDFRTINRFRNSHLEEFQGVFVQIVQLAKEIGLVQLGTIAVDGSKIKANASRHKAMSYGHMKKDLKRLKREIKELTRRACELDEQEDELYGDGPGADEIPEELRIRKERRQKIREAKARLEARQREEDKDAGRSEDDHKPENRGGKSGQPFKRKFGVPPEKKQDNFTDPESRIMKSGNGFEQCYNAQIAVDAKRQIIIAAAVTNCAADTDSLLPMLEQVIENTGKVPGNVLADSGYKSEDNFRELEERNITGYVALGRESKKNDKASSKLKQTRKMARRLESRRGKRIYRKRKGIAEPPFGWIKRALGFRQFSLRGLFKVGGEWNLACAALNLKRLSQMMKWHTA